MAAQITPIDRLNPDQIPVTIKAKVTSVRPAPQALVAQEGRLQDETGVVAFTVWKDSGVKNLKVGREYIFYRVGLGKREGKLEVRIQKNALVFPVKKEKDVLRLLVQIAYLEQAERVRLVKGAKITAADWGPSKRNISSILITVGVILFLVIMVLHFSGIFTEKKIKDFFREKKALFQSQATQKAALQSREGTVEEVVEGGIMTVRVGEELWVVYYLGLDVPRMPLGKDEAVDPWALRALNFNKYQAGGKKVRLDFEEWLPPEGGEAWAYVFDGEKMLNAALLEKGMARLRTAPKKLKYGQRLAEAETSARAARRGIWRKK